MSKSLLLGGVVAATILSGCATVSPQLVECLQPNRRAAVEIVGQRPPKPAKPKPGAEAKPEAEKKKPRWENVMHNGLAQGNQSWDYGEAVLKTGGKKELDKLVNLVEKGTKRDPRPTRVSAIVIAGHIDRTEEAAGKSAIAEARAKAVKDYLVSKGMDGKVMFWESKGAKQPVPVTKFCESN